MIQSGSLILVGCALGLVRLLGIRRPLNCCRCALHDAIHRAPGDAKQFRDFRAGVLSAVVEGDEVFFLGRGELGLLAAELSLGRGDLHAFAGAGADEVRFEFGDHGQDVEEELADGFGVAAQLPGHGRGRASDCFPDPAQGPALGAQDGDLLALGKGQAPALEVSAPARADAAGGDQHGASRAPAGIDGGNGVGDEIACLHSGPKDLQEVRPEQDRI
jgi:hypothetical protein